jgi:hypothetical protein
MQNGTKFGAVLSATAVAMLGFAGQVNAWSVAIESQTTTFTDVSICAATTTSEGSVHLEGTSTFPKVGAPAGFGLTSERNMTESLFADAGLTAKIVDVKVDQTVTNQNDTYWLLTGDGKATLPSTVAAGVTVYVRESDGGAKSLTVNNPSYNCPTPVGSGAAISVPVPSQSLENKLTTLSHPVSDPIVVSIPAGNYTIEQGSTDDAHPFQEDQFIERWYAVFSGPSGVVGTTSTTPDLATADVSKTWAGEVLVLSGPATSVVYKHAPGGEGPDSVYPSLLRLTPIKPKDPDPTTTTTTTTTTAVPLPKPDPPKQTGEQVQMIVPIVAVAPDTTSTAPSTTAPPTTAPPTAPPKVEIKGIQVEDSPVIPTTVAPTVAPPIALTGSTTNATLFAGIVMVTLGAFVVTACGRRRLVRR